MAAFAAAPARPYEDRPLPTRPAGPEISGSAPCVPRDTTIGGLYCSPCATGVRLRVITITIIWSIAYELHERLTETLPSASSRRPATLGCGNAATGDLFDCVDPL